MINDLKLKNTITALLFGVVLLSCEGFHEWDDFKKYTDEGEIVYPGRIQEVQVFPGENRVKVIGELNSDPKVTKYRIYWNDFADSVEFDASDMVKPSSFEHILEVEEGVKTFVFHTFDDLGNKSIAVNAVGASYGTNYRKKMSNRLVESLVFNDTSTVINWQQIDVSTGAQYTTLNYTVDGQVQTVETLVSDSVSVLDGFVVDSTATIEYATVYKPEDDCIDLFFTDYLEYEIQK